MNKTVENLIRRRLRGLNQQRERCLETQREAADTLKAAETDLSLVNTEIAELEAELSKVSA